MFVYGLGRSKNEISIPSYYSILLPSPLSSPTSWKGLIVLKLLNNQWWEHMISLFFVSMLQKHMVTIPWPWSSKKFALSSTFSSGAISSSVNSSFLCLLLYSCLYLAYRQFFYPSCFLHCNSAHCSEKGVKLFLFFSLDTVFVWLVLC